MHGFTHPSCCWTRSCPRPWRKEGPELAGASSVAAKPHGQTHSDLLAFGRVGRTFAFGRSGWDLNFRCQGVLEGLFGQGRFPCPGKGQNVARRTAFGPEVYADPGVRTNLDPPCEQCAQNLSWLQDRARRNQIQIRAEHLRIRMFRVSVRGTNGASAVAGGKHHGTHIFRVFERLPRAMMSVQYRHRRNWVGIVPQGCGKDAWAGRAGSKSRPRAEGIVSGWICPRLPKWHDEIHSYSDHPLRWTTTTMEWCCSSMPLRSGPGLPWAKSGAVKDRRKTPAAYLFRRRASNVGTRKIFSHCLTLVCSI